MHKLAFCFAVGSFLLLPFSPCFAQDREPVDFLPKSTAIYVDVVPAKLAVEHRMVKEFMGSKPFRALMRQPDIVKAKGALTLAEFALGDTLPNLLTKVGAKGMTFAIDAESNGAILLARAADEKQLANLVEKLVKMTEEQAKKDGESDSLKHKEYRGAHAYQIDKALVAHLGEWLLVTNKAEFGKLIVDRMLDGTDDNLKSNERFQSAIKDREMVQAKEASIDRVAWAFLDVQAVRDLGVAPELYGGQAENPGAELLIGGLLTLLNKTPYATADLTLMDKEARLSMHSPLDVAWIGDQRSYFFGENGQGRALPLLQAPEMVASVSAYRDISGMWLRAGDLFSAEMNDQLSQAESNLATLFSGKDFGEDILGAIEPEIRIVASKQTFAEGTPTPSIKLPQFALVAKLRNPDTMQRELRRTFQSLVGFLNVVGAMEGQPQLELDSEKADGVSYNLATFSPDVEQTDLTSLPIQFNFSPCLAFQGENVILSSTVGLAKQLANPSSNSDASTSASGETSGSNTVAELRAAELRDILVANQKQIVANNMLEKGQSTEQANQEFQTLITVVELFGKAKLEFRTLDRATLDFSLFIP